PPPPDWIEYAHTVSPGRPRSTRTRRWVALAVAMGVFQAAGIFTLAAHGLGAHRSRYPDHWDPRVAELATFVEDERDLTFRHPVSVDFVPDDQFRKDVTSDRADL